MIQILMGENLTRADGSTAYWCHLIASEEPNSLAITGADVGLGENTVLAAGSTIRWPGGKAMLYEDGGTFVESSSSSSDSGGGSVEPA